MIRAHRCPLFSPCPVLSLSHRHTARPSPSRPRRRDISFKTATLPRGGIRVYTKESRSERLMKRVFRRRPYHPWRYSSPRTKAFFRSAPMRARSPNRPENGNRGEGRERRRQERNTERGSGEARSIIDSPGTRELTVCLHEPASAGWGGGRGGAATRAATAWRGGGAAGRMRRPTKTIITE